MADPIGTVSGLSSGIQWRDMVDQIMQIEASRTLTPITTRQTVQQKQSTAWRQFQGVLAKLRDAAQAVRDSTSFELFSTTADKSAATGHDLLSATAGAGAAPGSYGVEVMALASAQKLGGSFVASSSTALAVAGSFALNGRLVSVVASDTLLSLRDKINAVNTGTTPSGVRATVLSSAGGSRLVLTSDRTGASGIEAVDDGATLQALGFTDIAVTSANISASGTTMTNRLSSATSSIATTLGISLPSASSMKVGGVAISVDLTGSSGDSLASIAARINSLTSNSSAASVVTETIGTQTFSRLVTDLSVEASADGQSARTLALLGFTKTGTDSIAQVLKSVNTFGTADTTTLLTDLQTNGQSLGVSVNDVINIAGKRGDGTAVTRSFKVGVDGTTVQHLLDFMNDAGSGFGAGVRKATASMSGSRFVLTDGTAGDSQTSLSLTVSKDAGGTISLGTISTASGGTAGRSRLLAAGTDAQIRVDGQALRRSTNAISDAIAGVTLNLVGAEVGETVDLTVDRNLAGIQKTVQDFAAAYNKAQEFIKTSTVTGAGLAGSSSVRSLGTSLRAALLAQVTGLTGSFTSAVLAGLQHDKTGVLSLDTTVFTGYLKTNFDDVRRLFTLSGTATDGEVSLVAAGDAAKPSASNAPYAVDITQAATSASVTGAAWVNYVTGLSDTMTIVDAFSGVSGSITLSNGDTIDTTVAQLNTLFVTSKMYLAASKTIDGKVKIASTNYGSKNGFTVSYTGGGGGEGATATLGIAAGPHAGLDVAGTIGGKAATGNGQMLTGEKGTTVEGLVLQYTGTAARAAGTFALSLGVGGTLASLASSLAADGSGVAAIEADAADTASTALSARITAIQHRLDARRAALTKQFVAMEAAMAQAQALGAALTAQVNSFQSNQK